MTQHPKWPVFDQFVLVFDGHSTVKKCCNVMMAHQLEK